MKLMECMLTMERKVRLSARACSHSWSPTLVRIEKKAGLLKNLLMVVNRTPTLRIGVISWFKENANKLDPDWEQTQFITEKISEVVERVDTSNL